jgi:hypothetical protein
MRNNFFQTPGYATDLVNVIIKGFSEKTYVCPHAGNSYTLSKKE